MRLAPGCVFRREGEGFHGRLVAILGEGTHEVLADLRRDRWDPEEASAVAVHLRVKRDVVVASSARHVIECGSDTHGPEPQRAASVVRADTGAIGGQAIRNAGA